MSFPQRGQQYAFYGAFLFSVVQSTFQTPAQIGQMKYFQNKKKQVVFFIFDHVYKESARWMNLPNNFH